MGYFLHEPSVEMEEHYMDYITEWEESGEKIIPYASRRNDLDFVSLLDKWEYEKTDAVYEMGFVPSSIYFMVDDSGRILGALHIRHELNDKLLRDGGHIGYGVRPSERKKGIASRMLKMGLPIAKGLGIHRALLVCDKENEASAKTILSNGGILENEITEENNTVQRYWIDLLYINRTK